MNKLLHAQIEVSENLIEARQVIDAALASIRFAEYEGFIEAWDLLLYSRYSKDSPSTSTIKRQLSESVPKEFRNRVLFSINESHEELIRHRKQYTSEPEEIYWFLGKNSLVLQQTVGLLARALDLYQFYAVDARKLPLANFKDFAANTGETSWVDLSCSLWRSEALRTSNEVTNSKIDSLVQSFDYSWNAQNEGHILGHCSEAVYYDRSVHFPFTKEPTAELLNQIVFEFKPIFDKFGLNTEQASQILEDYIHTNKFKNVIPHDKLKTVFIELGNFFA